MSMVRSSRGTALARAELSSIWMGLAPITPGTFPATSTAFPGRMRRSMPPTVVNRRSPSSVMEVTSRPTSSMWALRSSRVFAGCLPFFSAIMFPMEVTVIFSA